MIPMISHPTTALNLNALLTRLPALSIRPDPMAHWIISTDPGWSMWASDWRIWRAGSGRRAFIPDDRDGILEKWRASMASGEPSGMKPRSAS